MTAPKVPTGPGWWWRRMGGSREVVGVASSTSGALVTWFSDGGREKAVTDDGRWLCPVPTPDDIAARDAEVEALRVEVERLTTERAKMVRAAAKAIYFDDSSDYAAALWAVCAADPAMCDALESGTAGALLFPENNTREVSDE